MNECTYDIRTANSASLNMSLYLNRYILDIFSKFTLKSLIIENKWIQAINWLRNIYAFFFCTPVSIACVK